MKTVGLRELKNRLSEFVRDVRSGESVLVTDRGDVVAELVPAGREAGAGSVPAALAALARAGQVTIGAPNDAARYPKLPRALASRRAARWLDAERGDR